MLLETKTLEWIGGIIKAAPQQLEIIPMKGCNSSRVLLIQNQQQEFVLRLLDNPEWLQAEPDLARHETAALQEAQKTRLPAPKIIAYSDNKETTEFPAILMSHMEGKVELHPADFSHWLQELARQLAKLHQHSAPDFPWQYSSWINKQTLHAPDWSTRPALWKRAIELVRNGQPSYQPVFIHRDYHPANVLWNGNAISGLVDWINACQGPAGVDVAHCRNNLALMFNVGAADLFLEMYLQAAVGFDYDAYWDIDSILDMCLPEPEFYKPWQEFGMPVMTQKILQRRTDDYLESVLQRI